MICSVTVTTFLQCFLSLIRLNITFILV